MGCEKQKENALSQYCQISTCMGVTDWYLETKLLGKLFWAILIISGLVVTTFQTYGTIKQYVTEDPYSSSITKVVNDEGVRFPSVTVCNFNRAKQSVIDKNNLDPKVLVYIFQLFPILYDVPLWMLDKWYGMTGRYVTIYEEAWKNYKMNGGETDYRKILQPLAHTANDTFIQIVVGSRILHAYETIPVWTVYGLCYKIVTDFNQTIPGPFEGITINLNPQLDEYMKTVLYNNYLQQGFVISLNYVDEPFMSNPIVVAPSTGLYVAMKPKIAKINFANYPMRPPLCNQNPVLTILKANYTPQNCIYDCYMQAVFNVCGCILLVETDKIPCKYYCNLTTAVNCATQNLYARMREYNTTNVTFSWNKDVYYMITNCTKTCINPCDEIWSVETETTSTIYKASNREQGAELMSEGFHLADNVINETLDTGVMVKIYFTTSDVTVTSTGETTDIMTFVGNIGGQLGLWLGVSMFSLVQVLYYFVIGCLKGELCCYGQRIQRTPVIATTISSK